MVFFLNSKSTISQLEFNYSKNKGRVAFFLRIGLRKKKSTKKKKKKILAKLLTTGRDYQCDLTVKKGKV